MTNGGLLLIIWAACVVLHYGICVSYFERLHPLLAERDLVSNRIFAAFVSLFGPAALVAAIVFHIKDNMPLSWRL